MLKVHVVTVPRHFSWGDNDELADHDLALVPARVEEVWYWYQVDMYEGAGQILMRADDQYDIHDMGHCSCYGPMDDCSFIGYHPDELWESLSVAYRDEARILFEAAGLEVLDAQDQG
ncbi:MAG: hypothetical protein AMS18_00320 [Gemmatimonas sp. SG8_17]|nr:MAG: hypothetical protein AMS18_00320 [Gemmatimonas sp. SG8_17]